jgi:tRNA A-37 threonylcarbamoyl transferase component Bud32/predicted esterase
VPYRTDKSGRYRAMIDAARQAAALVADAGETLACDSSAGVGGDAARMPPIDSFPGYELTREIHRGGQGIVYQAIQTSTRRKVAIKMLREGVFAGSRDQARFQQEAQILGQFRHPGIVAIHDSGSVAGHFFLVMDYIPGQPLDVHMASEPRGVRATLELFARICDAVSAAHLRGVIHRDLKPSNIRIDADRQPHLLDFGLAKVALNPSTDADVPEAMTHTGAFIGSLPWASPEQAGGASGTIDIRTDVYSLGVVLFQMLTQRFPYPVTGPMRDVLETICKTNAPRPSSIRREIDDEIDTLVLKCLAKDLERRYQSAGELARDVRRYLAGEAIEAKRDSGWYMLRKVLGRYKAPTAIAAAFLVVGFGGGIVMTSRYYRALDRLQQAEKTVVAAVAGAQEARADADRVRKNLQFVEDVADIPVAERLIGGDADRRYMLIGPHGDGAPPDGGWRLLVVMPGGDGSDDFTPFVRRIMKHGLPDGYLIAQPIAPRWSNEQFESLVWPTSTNPWDGMRFSTEAFVEDVIADVRRTHKIDGRFVFAMGWSSGGPPCYAVSLTAPTAVTGSFAAMSVFRDVDLEMLGRADGQAYVVMHSPDDTLIPLSHPQRAVEALRGVGAHVKSIMYQGGHGWQAGCYDDIRVGIEWLEQNHAEPRRVGE